MILMLNLAFVQRVFSQNSPQSINYQAVARDGAGEELSGVNLDVEFSIYEGSSSGTPVFIEIHTDVLTDGFGLFTLKIGEGVSIQGNFTSINWSEGTYLNVSIDVGNGMVDLGTYSFVSVPYSLYSSKADSASYASYGADEDADPLNEMQQLVLVDSTLSLSGDISGTEVDLSAYNTDNQSLSIDTLDPQNIIIALENSEPISFSIVDGDADANNEIQSIEKVGNVVTLSGDGGSFIDEVNDADADSSNELQSMEKIGNEVTLSDNGGSFIDEVEDADADATNEIQIISKGGSTVTLSDGGGSFTDEVNDADFNPTNEIQTIGKVGSTVSLSAGGGSFTDAVNDADSNASNELISNVAYNSSNNNLTITEAGSNQSVDLGDLKEDENWDVSGQNIFNLNVGNVGINESNPTSTLHIMGSTAMKVRVEGPSASNYVLGDETVFIGKPDIGDVEVELPLAVDVPGRVYIIKKGDPNINNDLKIHATGTDKIDGQSTYILGDVGVYEQVMVVSDGVSAWWIISKN